MTARPSDRVRNFILQELSEDGTTDRLPTMRQLASQLDVSLGTVQLVYRQLKSEGHISTRTGDGSFLNRVSRKDVLERFNVALNYAPPEGALHASDLGKIYGAMLHAGIEQGLQVSFTPLRDLPSQCDELASVIRAQNADGVIIFPTGTEKLLVQCCREKAIPFACLQPPSRAMYGNYVSPEHFDQGYLMGRAFAAGQRKRVAFFASGQPTQSTSAWELLSGLTCGLVESTGESNISLFTPPPGLPQKPEALSEAISQWLRERRHTLPDAIFCHRANYSAAVLHAMTELGRRAPEDFALVTHADIYAPSAVNAQVTRVSASYMEMGRSLLNMLIDRIHDNGQDQAPVRIDVIFAGGTTTLPIENDLLGVQHADENYE